MKTCAGCGKNVAGEYVQALGAEWHPDCFRCAGCGNTIRREGFVEHEGRPYHLACYHVQFSPRCSGCGESIVGRYTSALGKQWHPEHFVCASCGKPFAEGKFFEQGGKAYCEDDYHALFSPRCAVCGEPLRERYAINLWGERYCERHDDLPKCYSCGRPISERLTGGGVRYPDGSHMCSRCRRTAIDDAKTGERVISKVRQALAREGLDLGATRIPLRLTSQDELSQRSSRGYVPDPSGMACTREWTHNGKVVRREVEEILVLSGLPEEHFATVAAHELGHAWLALNGFPQLPPQVEEGICELCEYLWLRTQSTPEARYRLELMEASKDPVYGAGYHAARRALEGRTVATLLEYVRREKTFP